MGVARAACFEELAGVFASSGASLEKTDDDTLTKKNVRFFARVCRFSYIMMCFQGTLTKNMPFLCQGVTEMFEIFDPVLAYRNLRFIETAVQKFLYFIEI